MTMKKVCALIVLLLGFGAAAADAQTNTGQISGTIRDSQGGVLPGVTVTVTNVDTGTTWSEITSPAGTYTVTNLPVGNYKVNAEIEGFRKAERSGFALTADGRITADFKIGRASCRERV